MKNIIRFLLELASIPGGTESAVIKAASCVVVCERLTPEETAAIVREVLTRKTNEKIDWEDIAAGICMTANSPAFGLEASDIQKELLHEFSQILETYRSGTFA